MSEGWHTTKLGDIADVLTGPFGSLLHKSDYIANGIPLINPVNIANGQIIVGVEKTVSQKTMDRLKSYALAEGDIVFGRRGEIGRCAVIGREQSGWLCGTGCFLIKGSTKIDPHFLAALLGAPPYRQQLESAATGTTMKNISNQSLQNLSISIPDLAEQQSVVAILDEAFVGLAAATVNTEKNLKNAGELFENYLASVFDQTRPLRVSTRLQNQEATQALKNVEQLKSFNSSEVTTITKTGGRAATTRHIEGNRSLSVGMPTASARKGWKWFPLDRLARMESGHTPSRRHPQYWGGKIPWIGIRDAKAAHGREISETLENTNVLGLQNSSARLLPAHTVCLSRTASVGYVTVMGRPMATSQDFVNWVCSDQLEPHFLMYLFLAQGDEIFKFSSGAVHQTIYFPEAKAFYICLPPVSEQREIIDSLNALKTQTERLEGIYQKKLLALSDAKQSILRKAFSGELAGDYRSTNVVSLRKTKPNTTTANFAASILAIAYERHRITGRESTFGHKKAQKLLHLVEAVAGVELGRDPIKDAAGPNDFNHMLRSTDWAEERGFFRFNKSDKRYIFERLENYKQGLEAAKHEIENPSTDIHKVIDFLLPMNSEEAEILATVYAAWNNLIIKSRPVNDEAIVREAREDWHPEKMNIPRHRFFDAIALLRKKQVIPTGQAKLVREKYLL